MAKHLRSEKTAIDKSTVIQKPTKNNYGIGQTEIIYIHRYYCSF